MPTTEQAFSAVIVCQWISNTYLQIYVFRYDEREEVIYIQAGTEARSDEQELQIYPNGEWEFINVES